MSSFNNRLRTPIVIHRKTTEPLYHGHGQVVQRNNRHLRTIKVKRRVAPHEEGRR